jgi:hypothetical protein
MTRNQAATTSFAACGYNAHEDCPTQPNPRIANFLSD